MKLAVITHTRGRRPRWLAECCESVRVALPGCGIHKIIECREDFQAARWDGYQSAPYVAVVDDDDRVLPGALQACIDALDETGAGVAFTAERLVDEAGRLLCINDRDGLWLSEIAMHPRVVHHLAVVRRDMLDPVVLREAQRLGCGIDWLVKAFAAMRGGAVKVPVMGYEWRCHPGGLCQEPDEASAFHRQMPEMRRLILSWMTRNAPIGKFIPR